MTDFVWGFSWIIITRLVYPIHVVNVCAYQNLLNRFKLRPHKIRIDTRKIKIWWKWEILKKKKKINKDSKHGFRLIIRLQNSKLKKKNTILLSRYKFPEIFLKIIYNRLHWKIYLKKFTTEFENILKYRFMLGYIWIKWIKYKESYKTKSVYDK